MSHWRDRLKALAGPRGTVQLRLLARGLPWPRWGNLRRTEPFSRAFGFERGTPVDRHYLHAFLAAHREVITGDVLEIQAPDYTRRFGAALRRTDSVDILPQHQPTYCCDLADADGVIPTAHYDCVLLPNTLSVLRRAEACLAQAWRVLRPGGTLLATAAVLVPMAPDVSEYSRLPAAGWADVIARACPGAEASVRAHGNLLAAVAALYGLSAEELSEAELQHDDPQYPVCIAIRARRPLVGAGIA